ncbi:mfs multidrug [Moniliophthora roreri MCA 2997]|uniref:Mfs multidrug n=1 Tax=Moniliophthora roreri (strain MCA 2997) TaxID=1381753 RepID=V2XFJ2_MONRO|nr:mfs multidrug [Moniliophthora roreri MCA 2997]
MIDNTSTQDEFLRRTGQLRESSQKLALEATADVEKAESSSRSDSSTVQDDLGSSLTLSETRIQETVISWNGPDDPENPRNWVNRKRWSVTLVVSLFTFISPVASSISSPSLPAISKDLNIVSGSILENMSLSIFVLAYALGPLIWGPLSELFGRLIILQISNIWFLIFNTLCGFARTPTQIIVFRFLAGFGGAAPQSLGGGVVGDLWSPEERGMAMALYRKFSSLGWTLNWTTTRWVDRPEKPLAMVAGFIFLRETYAPELLKRKARLLRKESGKPNIRSCFEVPDRHWTTVMGCGITKPLVFLGTEPIVQVFALYMAVLYGVLYLSLTTFVKVYTDQYGENSGVAGMHYLAIALGSTVGGQVGARVLNKIYRVMKAKNSGVGTPEMRLPLLMVSATTLPIGLLIYGWTSNARAFWLVPDLGVFIYSVGIGGNWTCVQTYLVDNYALHAASAIAGVSSFRAFAGFGFPLFADGMYNKLGDGWGNSILALICLVIGCPSPFIFYRYGPQIRARSKAAAVE